MAFGINFNVGWLQVTMDDALFMCGFHCLGDLLGERQGLSHGDWPAGNPLGERFPSRQAP